MFDIKHGVRPRAVAFAVVLALGLSACGGGGGGSNVKPSPPAPPPPEGSDFTGGVLNVDYGDKVILSDNFGGSIDLIKDGGGTLTLTGTNTYTGGTTITLGALQIGNGGTTGSIVGNVKDNGTLVFDRSDDVTFSGVVSGNGMLQQFGSGTLILTGNNTYAGGTDVLYGALQVGDGGTTGSIVGDVVNNGSLVFDRSDKVTFEGNVDGPGSLEQAGTGTLILTGANEYSGGTAISTGVLQLGNGGQGGSILGDVMDNGMLVFDRSDDAAFGGVASGSGSLKQAGTGTLTLTGSNTYTGGTTISNGTLQLGDDGHSGSIVGDVVDNGSLVFDNPADTTFNGVISGSGSLVKNGNASLILTAASTYDGGTTVDGGTLEILSGAALGTGGVTVGSDDVYPDRTLKIGSGVSLPNHILLGNGAVLDNAGALVDSTDDAPVESTLAGNVTVLNHDGGNIAGSTVGLLLHTSAVISNGVGSTISGIAQGIVVSQGDTITVNNDGGSIISAQGEGLFLAGASVTVTNSNGGNIEGGSAGVVLFAIGTVSNDSGSTIEANNSNGCGVQLVNGGTIVNDGGTIESAAGGGVAIEIIHGAGEVTNRNGGRIIGNVQMDGNSANTVVLTAGSSIQGDLLMGSDSQSALTLNGDNVQPQSYSDGVAGRTTFAGTLIKDGTGTWIIDSNDLSAVTVTNINGGMLQATSVLAGAVNVATPGTLDGVPGVAGDLSNAGRVSVHGGDSTVGGNYTQASTGTLAVSLGSKLAITGTATLNGGTLEITGADSGYVGNAHTNVLTAGNGVSGTFAQLVKDTGVVFTATTIHYDANSVWLDTTGLDVTTAAAGHGVSYTPASMGSALRVQGAFEQLDSKIAAGDLSGVSGNFLQAAGQFQQSPTLQAAQASLQSLSGQLHAASAAMTFEAIDASSRALSDRFDNLLDKGMASGTWTHDLSVGGDMARTGFDGVGFQLNGWMVGNDRLIGRSGVAGFAFGQSQGRQQLNQSFDHDNSRNTESLLYAGWLNGNWYTQGHVGFGRFRQDVNRQVLLGDSVQGVGTRYNGSYDVAYGESGLHFDRGQSHVAPFVNVEYARIGRDGFVEQGAGGFGLRSNAQTLDRWQAGLGLRASHHWDLGNDRAVDFSASAQWQRTLASRGDVFDASFVGLQQWQPLVGIGLSRYEGLIDAGLNATLSAHAALKFDYDYETGQRDHAQMLSARLNMTF